MTPLRCSQTASRVGCRAEVKTSPNAKLSGQSEGQSRLPNRGMVQLHPCTGRNRPLWQRPSIIFYQNAWRTSFASWMCNPKAGLLRYKDRICGLLSCLVKISTRFVCLMVSGMSALARRLLQKVTLAPCGSQSALGKMCSCFVSVIGATWNQESASSKPEQVQ